MLFLAVGCGGKTVRKAGGPFPQTAAEMSFPQASSSLEHVASDEVPLLIDDLDINSLLQAIERSLSHFNKLPERDIYFLGTRKCTVKDMKETLADFRDIMRGNGSDRAKEERIRERFDFYRSSGDDGKGRVLFTGYYEPVLDGSWKKTEKYHYPLYRSPGGMAPRYKRADIDCAGSLAGRGLEMIWVDDFVGLFFLHVQGSGKIRMTDGTLVQVGYAQSNGYPYRSISRYMIERGILAKGEQSMQAIKKYLREHPEEAKDIFNYNERYVFFRLLEMGPVGALNVPVTGGRTIAADPKVYPRGALAFIKTKKPLVREGKLMGWIPFSRFVLSQDTGSAIKGAGRIDIFCGGGSEAEEVAGRLKETGELYFLIKKM